jgi:hypothetical protein
LIFHTVWLALLVISQMAQNARHALLVNQALLLQLNAFHVLMDILHQPLHQKLAPPVLKEPSPLPVVITVLDVMLALMRPRMYVFYVLMDL